MGSQMAVRLSALRAGWPLSTGRFLVLISARGWVDLQSIEKSIHLTGTRTGDLLACSIVPQSTTLPRAPLKTMPSNISDSGNIVCLIYAVAQLMAPQEGLSSVSK
jgi:hypothetical protein